VLPDFGQVEGDPGELNLSTIETFLTEKRPFFLEGADLFEPPLQSEAMRLFYSRRVGAQPRTPVLEDDETVRADPAAAPIAAAAKLTGEVASGWRVAALEAVTVPVTVELERAGERRELLAAPARNTAVLHVERERQGSSFGATMTSSRPLAWNEACREPRSASLCETAAETMGLDWRLQPAGLIVAGQAFASRVAGGPERTRADGTTIRPGDAGYGAQLRLARESGENVLFFVEVQYASPKLDLNDAGYLERQNSLFEAGRLKLRTLEGFGPFKEGSVYADVRARQDAAGRRLWEEVELNLDASFAEGWWFGVGGKVDPPGESDRELRDGTRIARAPWAAGWVWLSSDARKPLSGEATFWYARSPETKGPGRLAVVGGELKLVVRPIAWYEATGDVRWEQVEDGLRYRGEQDGRYQLAPIRTAQGSLTLRQTVAISPRLTLQSYAELFLASGESLESYGAPKGVDVAFERVEEGTFETGPFVHNGLFQLTALLRWEFARGSVATLVYQRRQEDSELTRGIALGRDLRALGRGNVDQRAMLKVAYWVGI